MGIFQPRLMEMVCMTQLCVRRESCFIQRLWVDSGQPCFKAVTPLLLHPSAEALGAGAHRSRILRPETAVWGGVGACGKARSKSQKLRGGPFD